MPAAIPNARKPDEWQTIALAIEKRIIRGPGSTHGRVLWVKDLLMAIAEENYKAGKAGVDAPEAPPLDPEIAEVPPAEAPAPQEPVQQSFIPTPGNKFRQVGP